MYPRRRPPQQSARLVIRTDNIHLPRRLEARALLLLGEECRGLADDPLALIMRSRADDRMQEASDVAAPITQVRRVQVVDAGAGAVAGIELA